MPLTNADRMGQDSLKPGLIEAFPQRVQIAPHFPFRPVAGMSLSYSTVGSFMSRLGMGQVITSAATPIVEATAQPNAKRTFGFRLYGTRYQVAYFDQDTIQYPNDLLTAERHAAERKILYAFYTDLHNTLMGLFDADMIVGAEPEAFSLNDLDRAYSLICDNQGYPTAVMSSASTQLRYLEAMRAAAERPMYVDGVVPDPILGTRTRPVLSLHGTPWFVNDLMPHVTDGTDYVWIMVLGDKDDPSPGHGVTGIIPADRVGNKFVERRSYPDARHVNIDLVLPAGVALGSMGALALYQYEVPTPPDSD
jgi:hypothetical protein